MGIVKTIYRDVRRCDVDHEKRLLLILCCLFWMWATGFLPHCHWQSTSGLNMWHKLLLKSGRFMHGAKYFLKNSSSSPTNIKDIVKFAFYIVIVRRERKRRFSRIYFFPDNMVKKSSKKVSFPLYVSNWLEKRRRRQESPKFSPFHWGEFKCIHSKTFLVVF